MKHHSSIRSKKEGPTKYATPVKKENTHVNSHDIFENYCYKKFQATSKKARWSHRDD